MILKAPRKYKDVALDKFMLKFGEKKEQTQSEISRNLELVRLSIKAKHGTRPPDRKITTG